MNDFNNSEYIIETEPSKDYISYAWRTAIGLQDVDGLKPSKYLKSIAEQNIDGEVSIYEAQDLINSYYEEKSIREDEIERTEEADKVSAKIALLLSENTFSFTPAELISIHGQLFDVIYEHAGEFRDYNISKKEWVLNGESVVYGSANNLRKTLSYDFETEKTFCYIGLSIDETIQHLAKFVSNIWQIHPFGEGNTRTVAVFFIKYLRTLGFSVENDMFEKNSWFFRNALVRANYTDLKNGIQRTYEYVEMFLRNLLLDEDNVLDNRNLRI